MPTMLIDDLAQRHLIAEVPSDIPVWHWTRLDPALLVQRVTSGDLVHFTEGAVGRGLYLTTSAIDLIDKGNQVLYAVVPAGTRVLMVDPEVFGIGVSEFFEMLTAQWGFRWKAAARRPRVEQLNAEPAKALIPRLMDTLQLPLCLFVFGFHLAFMARRREGLRVDPTVDAARTVADYVAAHPQERPTLASSKDVENWLAANV